jgi:hypothetical protein
MSVVHVNVFGCWMTIHISNFYLLSKMLAPSILRLDYQVKNANHKR